MTETLTDASHNNADADRPPIEVSDEQGELFDVADIPQTSPDDALSDSTDDATAPEAFLSSAAQRLHDQATRAGARVAQHDEALAERRDTASRENETNAERTERLKARAKAIGSVAIKGVRKASVASLGTSVLYAEKGIQQAAIAASKVRRVTQQRVADYSERASERVEARARNRQEQMLTEAHKINDNLDQATATKQAVQEMVDRAHPNALAENDRLDAERDRKNAEQAERDRMHRELAEENARLAAISKRNRHDRRMRRVTAIPRGVMLPIRTGLKGLRRTGRMAIAAGRAARQDWKAAA